MARRILFPGIPPDYGRADRTADLAAGATVAVMLIPQALAYAMLAGMPPVAGLYAAGIPLLVYALVGTSRHLAVGPVAMLSIVAAGAVSRAAPPGTAAFAAHLLAVTAIAGVIQTAMGLLRLGFLVNYVSHAVIAGFTAGAAALICLSQVKHITGIPLGDHETLPALLADLAGGLDRFHPATAAVGAFCLAALALAARLPRRIPGPLIVTGIAAALSATLGLDRAGVATVGAVPAGLPRLSIPAVVPADIPGYVPIALSLVFVGYMEAIAVAKLMAAEGGYAVDPDRELVALGLADLAAALLAGCPVTGGFSRTAVNRNAGARSSAASAATAAVVILALLALTPLFSPIPRAALAAVVVLAVAGLADPGRIRRLFAVKPADGWTAVAAAVATLAAGPVNGVLAGVALSLVVFIARTSRPRIVELGLVEADGIFRNTARHPAARTFPGVLILRIDASLYFANLQFVGDEIRRRLDADPSVRLVILDLSGVNDMDAAAAFALEEIMNAYRARKVTFALAGMKGFVADVAARAGWRRTFGDLISHATVARALAGAGAAAAGTDPASPR